ncbi:MAG: DUF2059 domain-containing protein [Pseudomonadota bacterium]
MRVFLTAIVAVGVLALAPQARADDASRLAKAHDVVNLMHFDQVVNDMFDQITPMMTQAMGSQMHLDATGQARFGQILSEELHNSTPQLLDSVAGVYAHQLTEDQLTQVRAFLQTPAGMAFMGNQESVQNELRRAGQTIGAQVAARAIVRFNDERSAAATAGSQSSAPAH